MAGWGTTRLHHNYYQIVFVGSFLFKKLLPKRILWDDFDVDAKNPT